MKTALLKTVAPPAQAHPPLSRRARNRAAVRQRLFDAAIRIFAKRGFHETTIEEITEAADVGKGTFFNYFPSKEHLLTAFGDIRVGKMREALEAAEQKAESIERVLRKLCLALGEEPARSPEMARSMVLTMLATQTVRQIVCDRMAEGHTYVTRIFRIGQERGEVRRDRRATDLSRTYKESYFGAMLLWSLTPSAKLSSTLKRSFDHFWSAAAAPRALARAR